MTLSKTEREKNIAVALKLITEELGDDPLNQRVFLFNDPMFADTILRTTWEDLKREGYVEQVAATEAAKLYRLTPKGWLAGLEISGSAHSREFMERLGRLLAAMKRLVKGRTDPKLISPWELANDSQEAFGFIYNIVESGATTSLNSGRVGASWVEGQGGRLIEIPVDFNMEPIDIAAGLSVLHLRKIEELEAHLHEMEEDRALFHCPHCDAQMVGGGDQDFPEYHAIVSYQNFACGMATEDGAEHVPCPYGPNWPKIEEFEFVSELHGNTWVCHAIGKTERARKVWVSQALGSTQEEAESNSRKAASRKKKGDRLW